MDINIAALEYGRQVKKSTSNNHVKTLVLADL